MDDTVGKLFSDEYSRKARLFPAILAAVPYALILSYFIQSYFLVSQNGWVKVLCVGLGAVAFSTVAALWFGVSTVYWLGKAIEVSTFKNGVEFPTTEFLLWRDKTLSKQFKEKLKEKIFNDFGVRLFTAGEEDADCDEAKRTIRDAVDLIRPRVGDGKFVLQYNIRYGFIRNFIAGSFFAAPASLVLAVVGLVRSDACGIAILGFTIFCLYGAAVVFRRALLIFFACRYAHVLLSEYMSLHT